MDAFIFFYTESDKKEFLMGIITCFVMAIFSAGKVQDLDCFIVMDRFSSRSGDSFFTS